MQCQAPILLFPIGTFGIPLIKIIFNICYLLKIGHLIKIVTIVHVYLLAVIIDKLVINLHLLLYTLVMHPSVLLRKLHVVYLLRKRSIGVRILVQLLLWRVKVIIHLVLIIEIILWLIWLNMLF
jgi:hypothetical protein